MCMEGLEPRVAPDIESPGFSIDDGGVHRFYCIIMSSDWYEKSIARRAAHPVLALERLEFLKKPVGFLTAAVLCKHPCLIRRQSAIGQTSTGEMLYTSVDIP